MAALLATAASGIYGRLVQPSPTDCVLRSSVVERTPGFVKLQRLKTEREPKESGQGRPVVRASSQWAEQDESHRCLGQGHVCRSLLNAAAAAALSLSISLCGAELAAARPVGVNKPELLPDTFKTVIDVAGFLTPQQESRIADSLATLEQDTGFKLRVLAQNYPQTPGLAVKDYWKVDDNTIVFVADPSMGNILNFNVGASVDLNVPRSFWSRLAGKYGNMFFWREQGEEASIEAAVTAIGECLREPPGPRACSDIK